MKNYICIFTQRCRQAKTIGSYFLVPIKTKDVGCFVSKISALAYSYIQRTTHYVLLFFKT